MAYSWTYVVLLKHARPWNPIHKEFSRWPYGSAHYVAQVDLVIIGQEVAGMFVAGVGCSISKRQKTIKLRAQRSLV